MGIEDWLKIKNHESGVVKHKPKKMVLFISFWTHSKRKMLYCSEANNFQNSDFDSPRLLSEELLKLCTMLEKTLIWIIMSIK